MANIRRGYSDDFVLKNGKVGINTTEPQEKLDVAGAAKAEELKVTGVSSFTAYEGFLSSNHTVSESITLNENQGLTASLSGEIIVGTGVTVTVATAGVGTTTVGVGTNQTATNTLSPTTTTQSGQGAIESLKVYNTFNPPAGGTNDRPIKAKPGQLYYNQDFKTIEFWDGNNWRQVDYTTRSGRGVFGSGWDGTTNTRRVDSIQIQTLGNSTYFGDLVTARRNRGSRVSSSTRGIWAGGQGPAVDNIDYLSLASGGVAADFGNLLASEGNIHNNAFSSSTRGVMGGTNGTNVIQYIQISTTGNALDFGDLLTGVNHGQAVGSPTKGLFCGGGTPSQSSTIQAVTIASTGNSIEVGDLTQGIFYGAGVSNGVRGVVGGGEYTPSPTYYHTSHLDYITIASAGNAQAFGDLTAGRSRIASMETLTRGVFAGSVAPGGASTFTNVMDYITIESAGNAVDFGDITNGGNFQLVGCSDSHGGLGGF